MRVTRIDMAIIGLIAGALVSYAILGWQGVLALVVVAIGLLAWYLMDPIFGKSLVATKQTSQCAPQNVPSAAQTGLTQTAPYASNKKIKAGRFDCSGLGRVTEMQETALLAAAMRGFVYKKTTVSSKADQENSFNDKTITSLLERNLLDYAGGGKHYLTTAGRSVLLQRCRDLSNAWSPNTWAALRIEYLDGMGATTDRAVDVFDYDGRRFLAHCRLRDGEIRTFDLNNVLQASDAATGERIDDLADWLDRRRPN